VAGINGFIGAAVARCLKAADWRVVGLLRSGASCERLADIAALELIETASYAPDDLHRALKAVRADIVINLAAAGVMPGVCDLLELMQGNAVLAANLLQAVGGRDVRRFIHIGSCAEYAPGTDGVPMDEKWPQEPTSPYGLAKLTATHWARIHAQQRGVPLTVLRLFGVYGPGEAPHRLLPAVVRGLSSGRGVDLTPGLQQRDWLHVDDAAGAIVAAASASDLGPSGAVYNVCSGRAASVREIAEAAREVLQALPRLLRWGALPYRAEEPMWVVGNGARFHERTGWQPRWSWQHGVRATLQGAHSQAA
jgi:nucleoside-diphosphate-sugar epimerase